MSRYLALFRLRGFRLYWLGFTLSYLGDELSRVAFVWLVYERTGSAAAIGGLLVCFTAPILAGGFLAGWLLDRFDRRRVMLIDSLVRAGVIAVVPLLHASDQLALWHIYGIAAVHGLLMMIPLAGTPALVPNLVPTALRNSANAAEMLGFTTGAVLGPVLGGLLIARIGAPAAVLVDAASYLAFAACLWRLGPIMATGTGAPTRTATSSYGFRGVAALLAGNAILRSTTAMFLVWNIGTGMVGVWLPVMVDRHLGGSAELYGTLVGVQAGGQLLSVVAVGAFAISGRLGLRICLAQALSGLALLGVLVAGDRVLAVAAALALLGICSSPLTIWAQTLRMQIVPAEMRGRAFALMRMLMQGGRPLGGALGGVLVPVLGVAGAALLSGILAGIPGVAGLLVRALREARVEDGKAAT